MARTRGLTVKAIENLQARDTRYEVPDPGCPGLYLQIHPSGAKSWAYRYRFAGKSRKLTIGTAYTDKGVEVIKIGDARDAADLHRVSVAKRVDPIIAERERQAEGAAKVAAAAAEKAVAENTLRVVAEKYFALKKHLRSNSHQKGAAKRLVYPSLGDRPIEKIKRSEISKLLDEIEEKRGGVMADYVLAMLGRVFNWHAIRSDDYSSPIRRGMARTSTKARSRTRTMSEIEIRALWRASDETGIFGLYLKFVLLTATRRNEAAHMRRRELAGDEWTIPAPRYKTNIDHLVPLPKQAATILADVPKVGKGDLIFTTDGNRPIGNFGSRKEAFDLAMLRQLRKIAEEAGEEADAAKMERWTIHDLRRTARTLMSRVAVPSEHAEACLGHVKKGVEGTYDRYQYHAEKRAAFEKLASLIDRIVNPGSNVVALPTAPMSVNAR